MNVFNIPGTIGPGDLGLVLPSQPPNERGRQLMGPYFASGENRPTNLSRSQSSMSWASTSCLAASMAVASSG
jgi:hypothetical protein